jgi:hypothetical protein
MDYQLKESKELPLMLPIAFFPAVRENLLLLIRQVMNSIPEIWQLGPQLLTLLFF